MAMTTSNNTMVSGNRNMVFVFAGGVSVFIATGFVFFTTAIVDMKISSGQWWFYLTFSLLLIIILIMMAGTHLRDKRTMSLMGLLVLGLTGSLLALGIKYKPFDANNLELKRGLIAILDGSDKSTYNGEEVVDLDKDENGDPIPAQYTSKLGEVSYERLLPAAIDQGRCGSCWAVSSAAALSARYNKLLLDNKQAVPTKPVYSCPNTSIDVKYWHFSPQYILDSIEDYSSTQKDCKLMGKCNGNTVARATTASLYGVPNGKCVPYYAGDTPPCNSSCNSPVDNSYYSCDGSDGNTSPRCVKPPGMRWEKCADGSELKRVVETYEPVLLRGESAMLKELDESGPIVCSISFFRSDLVNAEWTLSQLIGINDSGTKSYAPNLISNGYISKPISDGGKYTTDLTLGGHALVVFGYGTNSDGVKYWEVRNSWGPSWGLSGNSKIKRGHENSGSNAMRRGAWGIENACYTGKVRPYNKYT